MHSRAARRRGQIAATGDMLCSTGGCCRCCCCCSSSESNIKRQQQQETSTVRDSIYVAISMAIHLSLPWWSCCCVCSIRGVPRLEVQELLLLLLLGFGWRFEDDCLPHLKDIIGETIVGAAPCSEEQHKQTTEENNKHAIKKNIRNNNPTRKGHRPPQH